MAALNKLQSEAVAIIDTAKVMVDKVLAIMELIVNDPSFSVNFSTQPLVYLVQLLERTGITYEDLKLWLTDFLIYILPALEIGVKTVMLTNLKNMISCSVDPRIPEQYRKRHKESGDYNTPNLYGIDIDIESIDYLGKLQQNPLSDYGRDMYFGLDGITDVYKFARAEDFDAFLWFVIHKGKFPMAAMVTSISDTFHDEIHGSGEYNVEPAGGTLLDVLRLTSGDEKPSSILPGNTFTYSGSSGVVSMCIEADRDEEYKIRKNTLVPVSDDLTSVNWYTRKSDGLTSNIFGNNWSAEAIKEPSPYAKDKGKTRTVGSKMKNKGRKFEEENGLCNLQYIDQSSSDSPINGLVNNKLRFTILPKPYVHVPNVAAGEPVLRFKKMRFDSDGTYNPNGKYSFVSAGDEVVIGDKIKIPLNHTNIFIEIKSGKVTIENKNNLIMDLTECYPGLTVYEFNYDYVMGMRLFDPKVLAASLLKNVMNIKAGINVSGSVERIEGIERIRTIVKNIINTNEEGVSDCFYTFDNRKYDELLRRTAEKKAGRTSYNEVMDILSEYDDATELHERKEIISRAIEQAAVSVSEGSDDKDVFAVKYGFISDLVENLIMSLMEAILSPKVLMLFEVNQRLMGGTWKKFSVQDIIKSMENIVMSIASEVRDLLLQELSKLLMSQLQPLMEVMNDALIRERLNDYAEVLRNIISNCPFFWFSFGNQNLETKLDTVDYADIDTSSTKPGEQPKLNKC